MTPKPKDDEGRDENVVDFPAGKEIPDEEKTRRVMAEATRLINLAPGEWRLWIDGSAERLGISRNDLEGLRHGEEFRASSPRSRSQRKTGTSDVP